VRNARENVALNGIDGIDIRQGTSSALATDERFDFVVANINRNVLTAEMPAYVRAMADGAGLCLSGFYVDDVPLLRRRGEELGLRMVRVAERNHWAMMLMMRP
jgi:ribosomal protein L11 methyltransferase